MPKMDPRAANMAVAVWNGYVQDARRHAYQWRPVDRWWQDSKDVGLVARARRRSSLCKSSSISLVDLVYFNEFANITIRAASHRHK